MDKSMSITVFTFISTLETSEEEPTPAALNETTCQKSCRFCGSTNSQFTWRVFA